MSVKEKRISYLVRATDPYHAAQHVGQGVTWLNFKDSDPLMDKYRVTVELVEEAQEEAQEEPRWWLFDSNRGEWRMTDVFPSPFTNLTLTSIYGTTADRDAKRDALLEAARKAGKP